MKILKRLFFSPDTSLEAGFTLIEMSIVLVIIGLIVGGVLLGQNLIIASEVRATISQIEKFNSAVNTFHGKFNALPGDIDPITANQFGFVARGQYAGEGDGNGILQGVSLNSAAHNYGLAEGTGETVMFWVDLSSAAAGNLIEGGFNTATPNTIPSADITGTNINLYLPPAKLGRGNYFYVYSGSYSPGGWTSLGINYYGLSAVYDIEAHSSNGALMSTPNIPTAQAAAIDQKIDDGMPQSGNVMAWYVSWDQFWVDGTNATTTLNEPQPYSGTLWPTSNGCYDNAGINGATTTYTLSYKNGMSPSCALSFKFQ